MNNQFFPDIVKDTSDTRSDSSEYDVDIEYEIDSLSEDDDRGLIIQFDSSGESEVSSVMILPYISQIPLYLLFALITSLSTKSTNLCN